jgi:hypothetical protein
VDVVNGRTPLHAAPDVEVARADHPARFDRAVAATAGR